jgi:hypothetical protein
MCGPGGTEVGVGGGGGGAGVGVGGTAVSDAGWMGVSVDTGVRRQTPAEQPRANMPTAMNNGIANSIFRYFDIAPLPQQVPSAKWYQGRRFRATKTVLTVDGCSARF